MSETIREGDGWRLVRAADQSGQSVYAIRVPNKFFAWEELVIPESLARLIEIVDAASELAAMRDILRPRDGQTLPERARQFMADLVLAENQRDSLLDAMVAMTAAAAAIKAAYKEPAPEACEGGTP